MAMYASHQYAPPEPHLTVTFIAPTNDYSRRVGFHVSLTAYRNSHHHVPHGDKCLSPSSTVRKNTSAIRQTGLLCWWPPLAHQIVSMMTDPGIQHLLMARFATEDKEVICPQLLGHHASSVTPIS